MHTQIASIGRDADSRLSFYARMYDRLYRLGYHRGSKYSHAQELCAHAIDTLKPESALDIGCALGWAVDYLGSRGVRAAGVDVSPTAVRKGRALGRDLHVASATDLPFEDNQFDLVLSTDCFEHLRPEDADRAIAEAVRVSRRYLALKINPRADRNRWWRLLAMGPLHLCLMPLDDWIRRFETEGCRLLEYNAPKEEFILEKLRQ